MGQTFSPQFDERLRLGVSVAGFALVLAVLFGWRFARSSWVTRQDMSPEQPISFSHRHHAGELQIDCRYCHTSVENGRAAGLPSTETCMTCHSQLFTDAPMLKPVRDSWTTGQPIKWKRANELPDFVYFSHQAHVNNGVACTECHGRVDRMAALTPEHTFSMGFCLECHRDPSHHLRPADKVTSPSWDGPSDQERADIQRHLMDEYQVPVKRLTECNTCHR